MQKPDVFLPEDPDQESNRVQELEAELELTKHRMQTTLHKLLAANEELRSTTEDLLTSKEELQIVNQENRHKVKELAQLASDLQNFLAATDIAILFLDRDLRIMQFTPQVCDFFNVRMTDRGHFLTDLRPNFDYNELQSDAELVVRTLIPVEREVWSEAGKWYLVRMNPYITVDNKIDGVVVTLVDVTQRKFDRKRRHLASSLVLAEQKERRRISILLHEDLQQQLHSIRMFLELIKHELDAINRESLRDLIAKAEVRIAQGIEITRNLAEVLAPPILKSESLADTLAWLIPRMKEMHGLEVELKAEKEFRMAEDLRALLFRIVRELLFNVVKHADTSRATVELRRVDQHIEIHVIDTGKGFDVMKAERASEGGIGLFGIHERLSLFGGSMQIDAAPGAGTHVTLTLPLRDDLETQAASKSP